MILCEYNFFTSTTYLCHSDFVPRRWKTWNLWNRSKHMGQVMKVHLSCYLVSLSNDSKTRQQDGHTFVIWPICGMNDRLYPTVFLAMHCSMGLLPDTQYCGCACAGNARNVFPTTAYEQSRHASRHVRHAFPRFPLKSAAGKNVPSIPGACATHNFTYLARGPCPGYHFTNTFFIVIHIWWKFNFVLLSIQSMWSLQNFAHDTKILLSWYEQNYVAIILPGEKLQ